VVWVDGALVYVCVSALNNFIICGLVGHVFNKKNILFKKLSLWFVDKNVKPTSVKEGKKYHFFIL
jgi:hypothetical protein